MRKEYKPQKTSISVTKRVFSVLVAIVVIAVSVIGVNAGFYPVNGPFMGVILPVGDASTAYTNGVYVGKHNGNDVFAVASVDGVGMFCKSASTYAVVTNPATYTIYLSDGQGYEQADGPLDSKWGVTYGYIGIVLDSTYYQSYASLNDGLTAYINGQFVEVSGGNSTQGNALSVSLPAGNILIADISNTGSNPYYMETTSGTTGAVVKPGMNNIQIGFTNTVPASFTVPNSSWDYPSWSGAGNASVLGTYNRQSTQGDFALSNTNADKYVIITNPMYPNDNNASANRLNSDLSITIEKVNSYVIYSLQTGYVSGSLVGTNDGTQYIDYEYDEDTGEWIGTNQDGDPASPVWGGQNDFENTPTTINDWLENIAHQISSFFSGAIGAITTLSVAVKNFAGTLMSLYVWLPSPVLSILSSAVMLAIVIGVIKVFI